MWLGFRNLAFALISSKKLIFLPLIFKLILLIILIKPVTLRVYNLIRLIYPKVIKFNQIIFKNQEKKEISRMLTYILWTSVVYRDK